RFDLRRIGAARRAEFPRTGGKIYGTRGRRADRHHDAIETQLPIAQHDNDRSRADDARRESALSLARRRQRRRLDRNSPLSQTTGAADLARRVDHGVRRRIVLVRPAAARWRAEACGENGYAAGGVGRAQMRWLYLIVVL